MLEQTTDAAYTVTEGGDETRHALVEPLSEQERRILKFFAETAATPRRLPVN